MTSLLRRTALPTLRTARFSIPRTQLASPLLLHSRQVASTVSNRPASQTFEHAATNVKEETGHAAADLAKIIAGANMTSNSVSDTNSFLGITGKVVGDVPKPVMVFGLAGGLPYIGASATTVYLAHQAGVAATGVAIMDPGVAVTLLHQALDIQVTYGAVMLSFLGALHWGMEFAGYGGQKGYSRLALGAAPVLFAWPTLALDPMLALTAQWAGFTGLWWADSQVSRLGWTPKWYSQYRFYLSILVGTCIIGSLAGTSYYGPVGGHGFVSHDLDLIRQQRRELLPENDQMVKGPVSASTTSPTDFVLIKKREAAPEKGEGEEEK